MKVFIVLLGIACVMGGCSYVNKKLGWDDDNPVEELLEDVFEHQTELDLDFTPNSPER